MATYEVTFKAVVELPFGSDPKDIADDARSLVYRMDFEPVAIECFDEEDD